MAGVDTAGKRRSVALMLPIPDGGGADSWDERECAAWLYCGIQPTLGISLISVRNVVSFVPYSKHTVSFHERYRNDITIQPMSKMTVTVKD